MKVPDRIDITTEFRARLAAWRDAKGLTQQQLADRSGLSQSLLARIESGALSPTLAQVQRIADALVVSVRRMLVP